MDTQDYRAWIAELKKRYRSTQIKAAISVNAALLEFYWGLGHDISEKYASDAAYGSQFFERLSCDLQLDLEDPKGLSPRNLRYAHKFYELYAAEINLQQVVAKSPRLDPLGGDCLPVSTGGSDEETVGLVLCGERDRTVVEYALNMSRVPMGVAQYTLSYTKEPPKELSEMAPALARLGQVVDDTISSVVEGSDETREV